MYTINGNQCYEELWPISPALGETTVAVETEREVEWRGGPQPWPLQPSSHYSEVESADQSVLTTARLASSGDSLVWKVRCLTAGETEVTLTVGNRPSASLPVPVVARSSVKVSCAVPHTLSLSPVLVFILCLVVPSSFLGLMYLFIILSVWYWKKKLDKPQSSVFQLKAIAKENGSPQSKKSETDVTIEVEESSNKPPVYVSPSAPPLPPGVADGCRQGLVEDSL